MRSLQLETIRSPEGMTTLADAWNALAERCSGYHLSQTHQWAATAWNAVARPRGRELAIVACRAEGGLVAVWPLVTRRTYGFRLVHPLGSETTEYCAPLVETSPELGRWTAELWRAAAAMGDVVLLPQLDLASDLASIVNMGSGARHLGHPVRAPIVYRRDHESWSSYLATISASHRSGLRRKRRRLGRLGEVTFSRASPAVASAMIGWLLDNKRAWMARRGLTNEWLGRDDYRDFLHGLVSNEGPMGSFSLFVLRVGDTPVAAQLNSVDRTRLEFFIGAHDPEFSAYSPGEIVTEECLRWALERDLDYDFRIGDEAYKFAWARRWRETASWHIATTRRGIPFIGALHAREQARRLRFRLGLGRLLPSRLRALLR